MFKNREEAGMLLAKSLSGYKKKEDVMVLGIARGGMVVARAISDKLKLLLDAVVIKKIGAPHNPELAIGAVGPPSRGEAGPKNTVYWDEELCERIGITKKDQRSKIKDQNLERDEREKAIRGNKKALDLENKTVILVDDGVATGASVLCAQKFLKKEKVRTVVLVIPVISRETYRSISKYFDRVVALNVVGDFYAVGQFYREFPQVSDEEVVSLLSS